MSEGFSIALLEPALKAVFQRRFPSSQVINQVDEALMLGSREVVVRLDCGKNAPIQCSLQILPFEGARGMAGKEIDVRFNSTTGIAAVPVEVPSGGWYYVCVKAEWSKDNASTFQLGQFGVGDNYVIAGQSYSGNTSEQLFQITDPLGRVSAFDYHLKSWVPAHDPMPNRVLPSLQRGAIRGSVWPSCMNTLQPLTGVPIGLLNFTHVATIAEWEETGPVFAEFVAILQGWGDFRAVLWAQGESDVIEGTSGDAYTASMKKLKDALERSLGQNLCWLLGRSTLHPYVVKKTLDENSIRRAQLALIESGDFMSGADTDCLGEIFRQPLDRSGHFNAEGQRLAGFLWFQAIWHSIYCPQIEHYTSKNPVSRKASKLFSWFRI